jgi:hypothetical protein
MNDYEDFTPGEVVQFYQEGAVEALVILRFNLWENLAFDDLTPTVRAMVADVEKRIDRARKALLRSTALDPAMDDALVQKITHERIIPHETGRLAPDE